jgi:hypothetical protein
MGKVEPRMYKLDIDPVPIDPLHDELQRKLGWLVRAIGRERTIRQTRSGAGSRCHMPVWPDIARKVWPTR